MTVLPCVHFADYNYEKCGWRPQRFITPKKGNPAILGNWRENTGLRPWPNKNMPLVKRPVRSPLTPKTLSPASSSFPCFLRRFARLFMEVSVSGWFAPRCASCPARARRCRASAWHLGMAPVVWMECVKYVNVINKQFFQSIDVNTDKYMRILHSLGLVGLPISTMKLTVSWY